MTTPVLAIMVPMVRACHESCSGNGLDPESHEPGKLQGLKRPKGMQLKKRALSVLDIKTQSHPWRAWLKGFQFGGRVSLVFGSRTTRSSHGFQASVVASVEVRGV